MASINKIKFLEELGLIFADPDSEGEYLPSDDDDDVNDPLYDPARDESLTCNGGEPAESESLASQPKSQTLDGLPPSEDGPWDVLQGQRANKHSPYKRSPSKRSSPFKRSPFKRSPFKCSPSKRSPFKQSPLKRSLSWQDEEANAGFEYLTNEEPSQNWIRPFDRPIGYRGETKLSSDSSPLDFLSLFLGDEFWNILVTETNRYAHQYLGSHRLKTNSRFHEWCDVTTSEMKAFLSLHLTMGLVEKSSLEDYWAEYWPTATPGFGKVMSRNRFQMILSFLHFANNEEYVGVGQPGHDRLFKLRPIIDLIVPRFAEVYGPSKQLSLDEMTIAFKGKSVLKMYNPRKPDKYGYKVFVLSEAKSGYVLQWSIYTGRKRPEAANAEFGATHLIVRELMAPYTGKGHEVYMDNFYTSPAIAEELASKDTGLCGTVRCNRKGMPKGLTGQHLLLAKGDDPVFMRKGKILACAWQDTKRVAMISTIHSNACDKKLMKASKYTDSTSDNREINRPLCVADYNSYMGGVDRADQRMKTYLFPHRSKKWYNRIFNAILSVSMVNAHIIYCRVTPAPHKPLKVFVQEVITALLDGFSRKEGKKTGRKAASMGPLPQRLTERHFIYKTEDHPDCVVCSDRSRPKGRRQTTFRCQQCGVGLCVVPCYEKYHTLIHYKKCHLDA
ncbi:piggyBac transposable element-derived protein 4-like [Engraulis encrasicolus]|uniref:piggyBac transposable element-derived protein 4-like n=1 Tax=Engraulis encrasicolus TaxID=184585 RepID=UPI002FCEF3EC